MRYTTVLYKTAVNGILEEKFETESIGSSQHGTVHVQPSVPTVSAFLHIRQPGGGAVGINLENVSKWVVDPPENNGESRLI